MAIFDTITKTQAQTHPMDFVNYCLNFGQDDVTFVELITPEQPTVEMHQADSVIKVERNGEEILVHFEFQTTDSYDPEMALRMSEQWLRCCVQTADSIDVPNKTEYLGILAVLGNLIYESELISNIIQEETMHQPNIIEYWTEKATAEAHQQGVRERALEDILEALELRLQPDTASTFKPTLEAIDDLQRLKRLHRAAILAESAEDFKQALEANEN